MKILLMFVFILFTTCSKTIDYNIKISVDEFRKMNCKQQAKYINSMNKEERMDFINKFLPNSIFLSPPNDFIKFYSDGEIIFDYITNGSSDVIKFNYDNPKYMLGEWKYENGKIILSHKNNGIKSIKKNEIWVDVTADENSEDDLVLYFKIENSGIKNNLIYEKKPESVEFLSPAIESYTKLKEEQRRLQAQTKTSSITETSVK